MSNYKLSLKKYRAVQATLRLPPVELSKGGVVATVVCT